MNGWTEDARTNGRINGWMNGWTDGRMDGRTATRCGYTIGRCHARVLRVHEKCSHPKLGIGFLHPLGYVLVDPPEAAQVDVVILHS